MFSCFVHREETLDMGLSVPPMGLAYIASSLIKRDTMWRFWCICTGWSWRRLSQWPNKHFDVLGCTVMTPTLTLLNVRYPFVSFVDAVVAGGPHPTAVKEQAYRHTTCRCCSVGKEKRLSFDGLPIEMETEYFPQCIGKRERFYTASPLIFILCPCLQGICFPIISIGIYFPLMQELVRWSPQEDVHFAVLATKVLVVQDGVGAMRKK